MKKRLAFLLSFVMLVSCFVGCSNTPNAAVGQSSSSATSAPGSSSSPAPSAAVSFTPGSYTATTIGHNRDFEVTVTFDANSITAIDIGENDETGYIGVTSMKKVKQSILEKQTLAVDTVSGATVSSGALISAVSKAVEAAGAKIADFKTPLPKDNTVYVDAEVDVVVVGAGLAGLSAAQEAAEQGLNVVLVEQLGLLGGSSVRAGYLRGGSSKVQAASGISYSDEDFINFLLGDTAAFDKSQVDLALYNEATSRFIGEHAGGDIDWLADKGVQFTFNGGFYRPSAGGRIGPYVVDALDKSLQKTSVDIRLNTTATEILMESGNAVGVKVKAPNGGSYNIKAGAVILATGGYNANQEMIAKYNPVFSSYPTDCSKGSDGSGMLMAEAVGAELIAMDQANFHTFSLMWRGASRSLSSIMTAGAIAVNAEGKRFINEDTYYDRSAANALMAQTGGVCYTIMDQTIYDAVIGPGDSNLANHPDMYTKGETAEELAEKLGINASALKETLSNYASYIKNEKDDEFNRSESYMAKADYSAGPYYGVVTQPELHTVHGGVKVDSYTRALTANGAVIPGLYAVGEVAASHTQGNITLTPCLVLGRVSAQTAKADMGK